MTKRLWSNKTISEVIKATNLSEPLQLEKGTKKHHFTRSKTDNYNRVKAIYPIIDKIAFNLTLDNYTAYISLYNQKIKELNNEIKHFNQKVDTTIESTNLNPAFTKVKANLEKTHKNKYPHQYNKIIQEVTDQFNFHFIKKVTYKKVTTQAQKIFEASLWLYNKRLKTSNSIKRENNSKAFVSVPKMDFNSYFLKELKLSNGYKMLDLCTQTVRNQRRRLEEAGVLSQYHFRGRETGIKLHVNNQILVVLDQHDQKYACLDTQVVDSEELKSFKDNNIITIHKNNTEYNEKIRCSHSFTTPTFSTGTHNANKLDNSNAITRTHNPSKVIKKADSEKFVAVDFPQNSEQLKSYLLPTHVLSEKLSKGAYFDAPTIDWSVLKSESLRGTLSRQEFKEVLINYFFIKSNKIYKGRTAGFGSWRNAIEQHKKHRYIKAGKLHHKATMLQYFQIYSFGLKKVKEYMATHPEFRNLYPNQYFDIHKTEKGSFGFEYWAKYYLDKRMEEIKRTERNDQNAIRKKGIKASRKNYHKNLTKQVRLWLNAKKTYDELLDYVDKNLPKDMQEQLPQLIKDISSRFESQKAA